MWLFLALFGYLLLAVVSVLDKFILSKSVATPAVYTFYSTIFMLAVLLAVPFGVGVLHGQAWGWAVVSGVSFGFGLHTMFLAVKRGEASHVSPFIGAVTAIATFALSALLFRERLTAVELIGLGTLIVASVILSLEKTRTAHGIHRGYAWAAAAGVLFAVSHVAAKYLYELYPFVTGFVWSRAAIGLVGVFLLFFPSVRRSFARRRRSKQASDHRVSIVVANKVLSVVAVVVLQLAIALGSVTIVNALAGLQFVLMFLFIYALTKAAPKILKEYFTRRELIVESFAMLLVTIGLFCFVVS